MCVGGAWVGGRVCVCIYLFGRVRVLVCMYACVIVGYIQKEKRERWEREGRKGTKE